MKHGSMHKANISLIDFFLQLLLVIFEFISHLLHHIRCTAYRGCSVISMLGYLLADPGDDKTTKRGDIKSIFSIATGTNNIDHIITIQINGNTKFKQSFTKPLQFFNGNAAHEINGHESSYFMFIVYTLTNIHQNFLSHIVAKRFVLE